MKNGRKIYPALESTFETLRDWDQTALHGDWKGKAQSMWVTDGAALIGDAAHGMNPHASQGRMQAMVDAITLADIVETLSGERQLVIVCVTGVLKQRRRPQVTMLQRLG